MSKDSKIRIDKWLWAVRVYKTRTLSTESCNAGKVKINGHSVKPSRPIIIGEIITVQKKLIKFQYEVMGIIEKRGSAKLASENVKNITPQEELLKLKSAKQITITTREKGAGRPTKKERRQIDKEKWDRLL